ncbi:hypothetical protein PR202_gb13638 [Eleusine coracana subsp. coracana]|uniref:Uncharacterized protein n=1 Tax=Eleusine coracana subsp. coracana TaxID=191504 RepID=A0AAV5ETD3_ELECO|nr:hypothetical protein PR202_gb13638 [Eleusine coracana subsp. coracana]
MDAQGALDSLLGHLTSVLINEAQLLGRIRGDVEFIKEAISGLDNLPKLKKLELYGDCNLDQVKTAIDDHPNYPVLKHKPRHQSQEDRTSAATSSSSAA